MTDPTDVPCAGCGEPTPYRVANDASYGEHHTTAIGVTFVRTHRIRECVQAARAKNGVTKKTILGPTREQKAAGIADNGDCESCANPIDTDTQEVAGHQWCIACQAFLGPVESKILREVEPPTGECVVCERPHWRPTPNDGRCESCRAKRRTPVASSPEPTKEDRC